ncbi:chemosensory receptor b [Plakobranchus ocellatus]|uniref:Chemosensory receptor b n=1 Tax=Plakobranchus ocellatus TaxID=259542 RepID=A0AAV4C902_9GAST|nr:chemosensory receptor b [Plakobranchus ocellatus]
MNGVITTQPFYTANMELTKYRSNSTDIKSPDESRFYTACSTLVIQPLLSVLALWANILNIFVFCRMELREGATVSFLMLSLADGLQACIHIAIGVCAYLLWFGYQSNSVCMDTVMTVLVIMASVSRSMSIIITTVIAVVRCCCVTLPFTVQELLTARRQLIITLVLCSVSTAIIVYITSRLTLECDDEYRVSIYNIFSLMDKSFLQGDLNTLDLFRVVLFKLCFVIAVISIAILIVGLRKSTVLRSSQAGARRNQQAAMSVILVLAIFLLCYIFPLINMIVRNITQEFRPNGKLHEVHHILRHFALIMTKVDCFCNIFVYYNFNSQFRAVINEMF